MPPRWQLPLVGFKYNGEVLPTIVLVYTDPHMLQPRAGAYDHPAILDVIKSFVSFQISAPTLTPLITPSLFLHQFNPMPVRVIAFVLTAVSHALMI